MLQPFQIQKVCLKVDESTIAELNTEIESTETVTIDDNHSRGRYRSISNTLTDAEKGALDKVADNASQATTSSVASTTAARAHHHD